MRTTFLLFYFTLIAFLTNAQTIYSKAYGNAKDPAFIFIHGGPSGNATLFEGTTARKLAAKGFYVIVYDRRGEGRSADTTAKFTYKEALNDLNLIYQTYKLKKANLIGHSFGGLVATLYTNQHPKKVSSLTLAGALVSQQETYNNILKTVKEICHDKKDSLTLERISAVEKLPKNSAEYRKGCFDLASQFYFFTMPMATKESEKLRKNYEESEFFKTNFRNHQAPIEFYKNEVRNNIDTKPLLKTFKSKGVKLFAIYGKDDQIFSASQLSDISRIAGSANFKVIENCSHYLFVDQQEVFIGSLIKWIKR